MRKRFLSVLLALSMFISMLPTTFAAQTATSSGTISGDPNNISALSFEIKNGVLQSLNIKFNRIRQGIITQEISEIVGGAEAQK